MHIIENYFSLPLDEQCANTWDEDKIWHEDKTWHIVTRYEIYTWLYDFYEWKKKIQYVCKELVEIISVTPLLQLHTMYID